MPHRAQQIADRIVTLLEDNASLASAVYLQREESLNAGELELPAVVVTVGDDEPLEADGSSNLSFLDSLLAIACTCRAEGETERDLLETLHEMRRQVHVSLMADRTLALSFVIDTRYGGASAPEFSVQAEQLSGSIETRWAVHYRMNMSDPN